jgi:protein TonB
MHMTEIVDDMTRCMTTAMTAGLAQGGGAATTASASDPSHVQNVAPTALDANRIAGNKNIIPDDADKRAIARSGKTKLVASFKLCIDVDGNIAEISKLKSSGFPGYDAKIDHEMHDWRYRPFVVNGAPAPVCTAVTFIYSQGPPPPPAP